MALQVNLSDANGVQAITANFGPVMFVNIPTIQSLMVTWIESLSTELPTAPGQPWNNDGMLAIS